jgi:hypothetical protein
MRHELGEGAAVFEAETEAETARVLAAAGEAEL